MINLKTKLTAAVLSAVVSINQALAMSLLPDDGGGSGGGASSAPELDGSVGMAAIAVIVSIAFVLYNRSKNR